MCRFVAYLGYEVLLADVLVKPKDSIIKQSLLAKEAAVPTNGDGFGIGWYVPKISPEPGLYLSIMPAWNDENLLHLANKIESSLFFAHVRAASMGGVNTFNCHPFVYQNWMFMHNGQIHNFGAIKRHLRRMLDDDIYNWIRGETDSEHFFALFLQLLKDKDSSQLSVIATVLESTFKVVQDLIATHGTPGPSYYNCCLTNGTNIIASRYCTDKHVKPETLYYLDGEYFWSHKHYLNKPKAMPKNCVIIASEVLTEFKQQWQTVPINHFIMVNEDSTISFKPIVAG